MAQRNGESPWDPIEEVAESILGVDPSQSSLREVQQRCDQLAELLAFPSGLHDDQVDNTNQALDQRTRRTVAPSERGFTGRNSRCATRDLLDFRPLRSVGSIIGRTKGWQRDQRRTSARAIHKRELGRHSYVCSGRRGPCSPNASPSARGTPSRIDSIALASHIRIDPRRTARSDPPSQFCALHRKRRTFIKNQVPRRNERRITLAP